MPPLPVIPQATSCLITFLHDSNILVRNGRESRYSLGCYNRKPDTGFLKEGTLVSSAHTLAHSGTRVPRPFHCEENESLANFSNRVTWGCSPWDTFLLIASAFFLLLPERHFIVNVN